MSPESGCEFGFSTCPAKLPVARLPDVACLRRDLNTQKISALAFIVSFFLSFYVSLSFYLFATFSFSWVLSFFSAYFFGVLLSVCLLPKCVFLAGSADTRIFCSSFYSSVLFINLSILWLLNPNQTVTQMVFFFPILFSTHSHVCVCMKSELSSPWK